MTKHEFVETLAEQCDLSKAEAGRVLDAILDSLTDAMSDGEEVRLTGFGTFSSQRRRAREGVNPQDPSRKIKIAAAHVPKFKPGASLRSAVAELPEPESRRDERLASAGTPRATPVREPADWVPLGRRG